MGAPGPVRLPPGIGPGRPFRWGWAGRLALLAVTLAAWAPFLSVLATAVVADALGCRVDEGSVHPCAGPFGTELGSLLYSMGVMGWLMLATAPFMLLTGLAWTVILVRWAWRRMRG